MTVDVSGLGIERATLERGVAIGSSADVLRSFVVAAGICSSGLFVAIGLRYGLQMYADGSIFSYSVAVQDVWAFHWHNISGRLFVYLFSLVPAETYVGLSGDPRGGIVIYGFMFFVAQLLGLLATFSADRSRGRIIFNYACFSTACLCPLVFGFPTELWIAHAIFWPALAICHYARGGVGGTVAVFLVLLALVFTHGGALIFAISILATLLLGGMRNPAIPKATGALLVILSIWAVVKAMFPPDDYCAAVLLRAALNVFNPTILTGDLMLLLGCTLAGYGVAFVTLRRLLPAKAHVFSASIVAFALAAYWVWLDHSLHAENRYYLRTVLLITTPVLGALAAAYALDGDGRLDPSIPVLPRLTAVLASGVVVRAATGAFFLVMLVHGVETAKFVKAWRTYKLALQALATGTGSNPVLGDARFVSSAGIGADLTRLSWLSTTHFLSVLVAPTFAPARLVVDPKANYFWLSCTTATANLNAERAVPLESRRLIRTHACLHR